MKFKKTMKKIGRQAWELFKSSIPAAIMYFCAGTVLMMLTMKEDELIWDGGKLAWTLVCGLAAAAYNALVTYAQGGNAYEMLVSGNMKRVSAADFEGGYKISSHKEAKEYREWKGFAVGGFIAIYAIVTGIIFGCNQAAIDGALAGNESAMGRGLAVSVIVCFLISGWSILPFYYANAGGASVSYFLSILLALLPIIVTGVMYIVGAYGRRAKAIKAQALADRAAKAEAQREKKINYGGLPGTKPRKRK
ncbi:MAG: hypothetical protein IJ514_00095 [Clostridia bacterium]|nr:hypothetical protein [Clostridia bacterium]